MGEADPTVELWVAGHALLDAWHADQNETDVVAVEEIAQVLQEQSVLRRSASSRMTSSTYSQGRVRVVFAGVLIDANIDAAEQIRRSGAAAPRNWREHRALRRGRATGRASHRPSCLLHREVPSG